MDCESEVDEKVGVDILGLMNSTGKLIPKTVSKGPTGDF